VWVEGESNYGENVGENLNLSILSGKFPNGAFELRDKSFCLLVSNLKPPMHTAQMERKS
jgi:hypothetical protein